jgi:hypothetical protein
MREEAVWGCRHRWEKYIIKLVLEKKMVGGE